MQPSGDEPVYVISIAAKLAGLQPWVLRVLDQEGIVVPTRTDSNRRLYSDNDIALLARVRHLTEEQKVNFAGVKVILDMERAMHHREQVYQPQEPELPQPEREPAPEAPPGRSGMRQGVPQAVEELALAIPEVTDVVPLDSPPGVRQESD